MIKKSQFVKDLKDKDPVSAAFLVKESQVAVGKSGKPYMMVTLMDKSGEIEARIWDQVQAYVGTVVRDSFVWIDGRCQLYQGKRQVVVQGAKLVREDEVEATDFVRESDLDPEALYKKLVSYVSSMKDPHYRALCEETLIADSEIVARIKRAPAAKNVHHAYKTGLLEHVISITGILDALSKHYGPIVDRDLLFLGGFFHDIGKLWELEYDRVTDYTTPGRLIGHLVMGVELIEKKINLMVANGRVKEFPEEKRLLAKHMVLAHHGEYEYGSPKRPKCLEALIVHYVDDLDSKVNSIHTFISNDENPGKWTGLHRMYERYFFKGEPSLQSSALQSDSSSGEIG